MANSNNKFEYTIEQYSDKSFEMSILKLVHSADEKEPFNHILDMFEYSNVEPPEWKSRYNSYVVYDYEPFCDAGFNLIRHIKFKDEAHAQYFIYLLDRHINNIKQLDLCYANSNKEGK